MIHSNRLSELMTVGDYAKVTDVATLSSQAAATVSLYDQTLHVGTAIQVLIYDTTRDYDGGAWTSNTADTTWYNEALGGTTWLGRYATATEAWTAAKKTVGGVYQNTNDRNFYAVTSVNTHTTVYRGVKKKFPTKVAIVLESLRMVIYDLTAAGCPMWMVVIPVLGYLWRNGRPATCVSALNGQIAIGLNDAVNNTTNGIISLNFALDQMARYALAYQYGGSAGGIFASGISARHDAALGAVDVTTLPALVSAYVNGCKLIAERDAPINPTTKLPTNTILVATTSGVAVVTPNGILYNDTSNSGSAAATKVGVSFDGRMFRTWHTDGMRFGVFNGDTKLPIASSSSLTNYDQFFDVGAGGSPVFLPGPGWLNAVPTEDGFALTGTKHLVLLKNNPSNRAKSMAAYIADTLNTGWMAGDARGAYLCDTSIVADTSTKYITGSIVAASDAAVSDEFGYCCALSGNGLVLAVGAFFWEGAFTDQGGVYIYDWTGSAWAQRGSVVTAGDAETTDYFGTSCALSANGSVLAVGATRWDGAFTDQGGVYIYDWTGSAWVQRGGVLTAADAAAGDSFGSGCSLSADGSILAVGAIAWEGAFTDQGCVYIYDWTGGAWVQRGGVLTAADAAASDGFGYACPLTADGSVLVVGSFMRSGALTSQGGVYTYDWTGSAWVQRGGVLTAADAETNDRFGRSCALSADGMILAVGVPLWEGPFANQGGVYIYDWTGGAWVQRGYVLTAADATADDRFGGGCALSADGSVLAVGAFLWEGPVSNQGSVYVCRDVASLSNITDVVWDRSPAQVGANVYGALTKAPVATGNSLVGYRGFSASKYIEQPYNSNLDFGTGDFAYYGWFNADTIADGYLLTRGSIGGPTLALTLSSGVLYYVCDATGSTAVSTSIAVGTGLHFVAIYRLNGVLTLSLDNRFTYSAANTTNLTNTVAVMRLGLNLAGTRPLSSGSWMSLWRCSANALLANQIAQIYRDELPLFQLGAKCVLDSATSTVASYDPITKLTHVLDASTRYSFKQLLRVESSAYASGTTIDTLGGTILLGSTSVKITQPAISQKDELFSKGAPFTNANKEQQPIFFDTITFTSPTTSGSPNLTGSSVVGTPYVGMGVTGTGIPAGTTLISVSGTSYVMSANATVTNAGAVAIGQNTFTLPVGFNTQTVYVSGSPKRQGATKDYTLSFDGYVETIVFATSPGAGTWVGAYASRQI